MSFCKCLILSRRHLKIYKVIYGSTLLSERIIYFEIYFACLVLTFLNSVIWTALVVNRKLNLHATSRMSPTNVTKQEKDFWSFSFSTSATPRQRFCSFSKKVRIHIVLYVVLSFGYQVSGIRLSFKLSADIILTTYISQLPISKSSRLTRWDKITQTPDWLTFYVIGHTCCLAELYYYWIKKIPQPRKEC